MRAKAMTLAAIAAVALGACSGKSAPAADHAFAAQRGREDAAKAAQAKPGTMQREKALLHIRATEYKLLQAADSATAAAYKQAAAAYLDSVAAR